MTLNRGTALFTQTHPWLLFRGPEFDARTALRAGVAAIREAICGIGGHEYFTRLASNRIYLHCLVCGHETPGWCIDGKTRPRRITRRA
jgi:hypothetical protein